MTPTEERDTSKQTPPPENDTGEDFADAGGPVGDVDPEEIIAHEDRIGELESSIDEWKTKYQRALADFQNFQRRSIENEREARRQGVTSVVAQLMGVLDNFDLALRIDTKAGAISLEKIVEGVQMIRRQLLQSMANIDVTPIEPAAGDEFDPHRHEAVAQVPAEGVECGRVAATFQAGYRLGDRVLRPAKVSVAKAAAPKPDLDETV